MISFIGILAVLGGIAVIVGEVFPTFVNYPLIYIGAGISIFAGLIDIFRKRNKY